jgi:hypothetical protein
MLVKEINPSLIELTTGKEIVFVDPKRFFTAIHKEQAPIEIESWARPMAMNRQHKLATDNFLKPNASIYPLFTLIVLLSLPPVHKSDFYLQLKRLSNRNVFNQKIFLTCH